MKIKNLDEDVAEPHCIFNGHGQMRIKTNKKTKEKFWGCIKWPECVYTINYDDWCDEMAEKLGYCEDEDVIRYDRD